MLKSKNGLDRCLDGWVNHKAPYAKELEHRGILGEKELDQCLYYLSQKLGHKNDHKVAEHAICKTYRQAAYDLFFKRQDLFDIVVRDGTVIGFVTKKWGEFNWERFVPTVTFNAK